MVRRCRFVANRANCSLVPCEQVNRSPLLPLSPSPSSSRSSILAKINFAKCSRARPFKRREFWEYFTARVRSDICEIWAIRDSSVGDARGLKKCARMIVTVDWAWCVANVDESQTRDNRCLAIRKYHVRVKGQWNKFAIILKIFPTEIIGQR